MRGREGRGRGKEGREMEGREGKGKGAYRHFYSHFEPRL